MGKKGKGKKRLQVDKQGRINTKVDQDELEPQGPRSFVIARDVPQDVNDLVANVRLMMSPNTAAKLKVRKRNVIKDFVHMAAPFGVTHLLIFNKTKAGTNLRIGRIPRGPTLTFRVNNYTLIRDIAQNMSKPKSPGIQYRFAPLLVLNNFSGDAVATKLVTKMFQNMFPSIDVSTVDLKTLKRVVLLHNDPDAGVVHMRHYEVGVKPAGISKTVKAVLRTNVPDLSKFNDISDFVLGGGAGYESDASDMGDANKVTLPQNVSGAGNTASKKSSIRLQELGPRMTLSLLKIEEGLCGGDVLFHSYLNKTDSEVKDLTEKREAARKLREQRRVQQAQNVKRKEQEKAENRERSYAGQQRRAAKLAAQASDIDPEQAHYKEDPDASSDDDAAWYKQEVGEAPEKDMFRKHKRTDEERKTYGAASKQAEKLLKRAVDKRKSRKEATQRPVNKQKSTGEEGSAIDNVGQTRKKGKSKKRQGLAGATLQDAKRSLAKKRTVSGGSSSKAKKMRNT